MYNAKIQKSFHSAYVLGVFIVFSTTLQLFWLNMCLVWILCTTLKFKKVFIPPHPISLMNFLIDLNSDLGLVDINCNPILQKHYHLKFKIKQSRDCSKVKNNSNFWRIEIIKSIILPSSFSPPIIMAYWSNTLTAHIPLIFWDNWGPSYQVPFLKRCVLSENWPFEPIPPKIQKSNPKTWI